MLTINDLTVNDKLKFCEAHLLNFTKYIYKENHRRTFTVAPHFVLMANALMNVINGKTKRLIINIPPRYGKTELAVKMFIAYGLALNPQSKFIHLSYSDDLALDNSSQTKEYIESDAFQELWRMQLKKDAQGKKKWFNQFGGGVYATASGGAITGFGAGVTDSEIFSGAIIIDDPLKPDDALSDVKRKAVNERYNGTIRSRVNDRNTPIIVIMQRLHEEDLSGYLLDGGSGEQWEHLCLPALDKNNIPLWEQKHNFKELEQIRQASRYNFAGQYMQIPSPEEGGEWKKEWFEIIDKSEVPNGLKWELIIDGAYTKNTQNDPTGLQIGARSGDNYIIYQSIDKYLEMPELIQYIPKFIDSSGVNVSLTLVEPKASGKSIAQLLRSGTRLNIAEINTSFVNTSKIENVRTCSPYIEGGRVKLVKGVWNDSFLQQVGTFPNAKHDEHIDLTCYGIERNLLSRVKFDIR
jgi:predicted phage terminase large subunit-like protein